MIVVGLAEAEDVVDNGDDGNDVDEIENGGPYVDHVVDECLDYSDANNLYGSFDIFCVIDNCNNCSQGNTNWTTPCLKKNK